MGVDTGKHFISGIYNELSLYDHKNSKKKRSSNLARTHFSTILRKVVQQTIICLVHLFSIEFVIEILYQIREKEMFLG